MIIDTLIHSSLGERHLSAEDETSVVPGYRACDDFRDSGNSKIQPEKWLPGMRAPRGEAIVELPTQIEDSTKVPGSVSYASRV